MSASDPLTLDVSPQLARGEEPFAIIMAATDTLLPGQALRLIAPFRPAPLFSVMLNRGYAAQEQALPQGGWEVLFTPLPAAPAENEGLAPGSAPDAGLWPDPVDSLDLRGMIPPEPMVRVLETLEGMAAGEVLFVLLEREPMPLFPELAQRDHEWAGNFAMDGASYRLMIRRG